jgi:hypothetical protein
MPTARLETAPGGSIVVKVAPDARASRVPGRTTAASANAKARTATTLDALKRLVIFFIVVPF